MKEVRSEFSRRVGKCVERETGIKVTQNGVYQSLEHIDRIAVEAANFRCGMRVLKRLAKRKFIDCIQIEAKEVQDLLDSVGERLVNLASKLDSPLKVFESLVFFSDLLDEIEESIEESEIFTDQKLTQRMLLIHMVNESRHQAFYGSIRPLLFSTNLAQYAIQKNVDWSTSIVALTTEEILVRDFAKKLGLTDAKGEEYWIVVRDLVSHLESKGIRVSRDVVLSDGHRKIRNKILHEGWNPTPDETDGILTHVYRVAEFLHENVKI